MTNTYLSMTKITCIMKKKRIRQEPKDILGKEVFFSSPFIIFIIIKITVIGIQMKSLSTYVLYQRTLHTDSRQNKSNLLILTKWRCNVLFWRCNVQWEWRCIVPPLIMFKKLGGDVMTALHSVAM